MADEIPRRCRIDLSTPAELAIRAAVDAVEALPPDVRLTDAVVLLASARERVADYVDGVPGRATEVMVAATDDDIRSAFAGVVAFSNQYLPEVEVPVRQCVWGEPPWSEIDPGIVGAVRALHAAGFATHDSGDGRHKASLGWAAEDYSHEPHVVITCTGSSSVYDELREIHAWALHVGLHLSQVSIQGIVVPRGSSEEFARGQRPGHSSVVWVSGEPLRDWVR